MPRFTVHRKAVAAESGSGSDAKETATQKESTDPVAKSANSETDLIPNELRVDSRLQIVDEMPRLLLVECDQAVATEWQARLPGWAFQPERKAKIPDTRQKIKRRAP